MSYEQKDNSGILFKNNKKEKLEQPDSTGNATIAGVKYRVAGWTKTSKDGNKFLTLAFRVDDGISKTKPAAQRLRAAIEEVDQEIRF